MTLTVCTHWSCTCFSLVLLCEGRARNSKEFNLKLVCGLMRNEYIFLVYLLHSSISQGLVLRLNIIILNSILNIFITVLQVKNNLC